MIVGTIPQRRLSFRDYLRLWICDHPRWVFSTGWMLDQPQFRLPCLDREIRKLNLEMRLHGVGKIVVFRDVATLSPLENQSLCWNLLGSPEQPTLFGHHPASGRSTYRAFIPFCSWEDERRFGSSYQSRMQRYREWIKERGER